MRLVLTENQEKKVRESARNRCEICAREHEKSYLLLDRGGQLKGVREGVRGLLCARCIRVVRAIGYSSTLLQSAADYISRTNARPALSSSEIRKERRYQKRLADARIGRARAHRLPPLAEQIAKRKRERAQWHRDYPHIFPMTEEMADVPAAQEAISRAEAARKQRGRPVPTVELEVVADKKGRVVSARPLLSSPRGKKRRT